MLRIDAGGMELVVDLDRGRLDLLIDGSPRLRSAFGEVAIQDPEGGEDGVFRTSGRYARSGQRVDETDDLGQAQRLVIELSGHEAGPDLLWTLSVYPARGMLTAQLVTINTTDGEIRLAHQVPLKVDAERDGGLLIGTHPSEHRILEAGSFFAFDFFVDLVPGDVPEPVETVALGMVHGYQKGHSISNWNHAIRDQISGTTFVAGSLDFELSGPMFNTSFDPDLALPEDGRTPFTYWSGEFPYLPNGKPVPVGGSLSAGPVAVIPNATDALAALEDYALALKQHNRVALWTERGPDNRVPTGWNSWTGSGSSGGYGSDIDQTLMLDNLQAMAEEFGDFGGEWFQIDDGYEYFYGDWDWRPDRFPDGAAWMADQIQALGLIPGVWIAAFQVDLNSETYAAHVDDGWFPETLPFIGGDKPVIDLSHPQVQAWLTDRFRRIRADGYRWVKTDFGYWAMGVKEFWDEDATREEAYRMGLAAIRAGLDQGAAEAGGQAGDTFWLNVSLIGPHVGHVDSIRPNLDTMPAWDREADDQDRKEAQGFKPTVRTIARRYYLHGRVYLFNHDMLFFRSHKDESVPRITRDEARCLLSVVALSGSVAKLGEKIVEMEPEWIQDFRTALPVFGRSARPLDLFEREYPELWHLAVVPSEGLNTGGDGPAYDVFALFNWGSNEDLTTNPYSPMADVERSASIDLSQRGLNGSYVGREFWTGEVVAPISGFFNRSLQPHTVELWALRPLQNRPQYLGGNRHLLQGAVEIRALNWDPVGKVLSIDYDAAPQSANAPFVHELVFWVPTGWALVDSSVEGASVGSLQSDLVDQVLRLSFQVDQRKDVDVRLTFVQQ